MYKDKYLKYKNKYLTLKNGGSLETINEDTRLNVITDKQLDLKKNQLFEKEDFLKKLKKKQDYKIYNNVKEYDTKTNETFYFLKDLKKITDYEIDNHIHRLESFYLKDAELIVFDIKINKKLNIDEIIFYDNKNNFTLSISEKECILKETRYYLNNYNSNSINKKTVDLNNNYSIILTLYVQQKVKNIESKGGKSNILCEGKNLSDIYPGIIPSFTTPESTNLFISVFSSIYMILFEKCMESFNLEEYNRITILNDKIVYFCLHIMVPLFQKLNKIFKNELYIIFSFIKPFPEMNFSEQLLHIIQQSINDNIAEFNYGIRYINNKIMTSIVKINEADKKFNIRLLIKKSLNKEKLLKSMTPQEFITNLNIRSDEYKNEFNKFITFDDLCDSTYHSILELYHLNIEENKYVHNGIYSKDDINSILNIFNKTIDHDSNEIQNELKLIHGYLHNYDKIISTNDPDNIKDYLITIDRFVDKFSLHCFEILANKNKYHMLLKGADKMFIIDSITNKYKVYYTDSGLKRKKSQNNEVVEFSKHTTIRNKTFLFPNHDYITNKINDFIINNSGLFIIIGDIINSIMLRINSENINEHVNIIISEIKSNIPKFSITPDEVILDIILLYFKYLFNSKNYLEN